MIKIFDDKVLEFEILKKFSIRLKEKNFWREKKKTLKTGNEWIRFQSAAEAKRFLLQCFFFYTFFSDKKIIIKNFEILHSFSRYPSVKGNIGHSEQNLNFLVK